MADILTSVSTRSTPQKRQARADQVKNTAGGYVFQVGDEGRLHRFLTLGTDGATYYTSAGELTRQNAEVVFRMAAHKPDELIAEILAVSEAGRAPKANPALFALAIAASAEAVETRQKALAVLHRVARTGTHLYLFNTYVEQFRGRGRALNRAVRQWYTEKPVDKLAYQAVKYRSRGNWTHRDLLRLTKPGDVTEPMRDKLLGWIARGAVPDGGELPAIVGDFLALQSANDGEVCTIIRRGNGVSWEMIPDAHLNSVNVWATLVEVGVPQTALMRQLPRLTNLGLGTGATGRLIAAQLVDAEKLKRARVHPVNVLIAMRTYAQGHGEKGKLSWTPERLITDALDAAFYAAYGAVEPSGKRLLLALDVSGSMGFSKISNLPITPREAAAALAMVTANVESDYEIVGFTGGNYTFGGRDSALSKLDISPRRRLDDVCRYTAGLNFGSTDCSLPMRWAFENRLEFDTFLILTDNETWAGAMHPHQALEAYRQRSGIAARQIVVGMTATNFSIADPNDPLTLDVAGFDSAVPQLIGDFAGGRL